MQVTYKFETIDGLPAWYVKVIDDETLISMAQETEAEAKQLTKDIVYGQVELIPLGGEFIGRFWFTRIK